MLVVEIAPRRRGLALMRVSTPPPQGIDGAEYEKEQLLVDREILTRCGITVNMELSETDIRELIRASEFYRAKQRAVWLLSQGDLSERALYDKLCLKFTEGAAAFAVAQMVKKGYINDYNYAERLIVKWKEKNLSQREIKNKLFLKGVSTEIINAALSNASLEYSEVSRVVALIKTKYKNKIGSKEEIRKTVAALVRRGFSYSNIKAALSKLRLECEGENDGI